jgi:hypothetical protein
MDAPPNLPKPIAAASKKKSESGTKLGASFSVKVGAGSGSCSAD